MKGKTFVGQWDYTMTAAPGVAPFMQSQILLESTCRQMLLKKIIWDIHLNLNMAPIFTVIPLEQNTVVDCLLQIGAFGALLIGTPLTNIAGTVITNNFLISLKHRGEYNFNYVFATNNFPIIIRFDNLDLLNAIRVQTQLIAEIEEIE